VTSRFLCTCLVVVFPYARESGLGSAFAGAGAREVILGSLSFVPALWLVGAHAAPAAVLGGLLGLVFAARVSRKLSGLTGDVYGASIELCEVGVLLGLGLSGLHLG